MTESTTRSGIPLKPFYSPADLDQARLDESLAPPGEFPYTRGRRREPGPWIHRELSGEGGPARANEQFKYLLSRGQRGIDVIGDVPTASCMDPDHPICRGSIGLTGVSLCRQQDYLELYDGIPLAEITISNSLAPLFALPGLVFATRAQGVPLSAVRGSLVQLPLYAEGGTSYSLHWPHRLWLRMTLDSIVFCTREMPKFHPFLENTYTISEGGLNAVEELALGFVEIRYVVRKLLERGLAVDSFAPRIALLVNCHMDFFETVAKIRAARRMYARMMRDEFGARDPRSMAINIASHTSGLAMTAPQPVLNVVRGATQALSLALAGVQAMEISTFDEAYRVPSPEAHLVGLRTQQVLELETGVTRVLDPLGGSYFVEALTDEMERRIADLLWEIESKGDPGELAENGWFRRFVNATSERYARELRDGRMLQVGVNVHRIPPEEDTLLRQESETKIRSWKERAEEIRAWKAARDRDEVVAALRRLHQRVEDPEDNLIDIVIEATAAQASFGEITGELRRAYGGPYDPYRMMVSPLEA
jgi:methylmalonyl-CoA mutase N-terminal domain/subunit